MSLIDILINIFSFMSKMMFKLLCSTYINFHRTKIKMDVEIFQLKVKNFPRFKYALKYSREPLDRYHSITNKCVDSDEKISVPEKVNLFISKKRRSKTYIVKVKDIVNEIEEIKKLEVLKGVNSNIFLNYTEKWQDCISVLVLPADMKAELARFPNVRRFNCHIVFIASNEQEKKDIEETIKCDKYENFYMSTTEDIAQDIDNLLEKTALKPLKKPCEQLDILLHHRGESLCESTVPNCSKERSDAILTRQCQHFLRGFSTTLSETVVPTQSQKHNSSNDEQEKGQVRFSKRLRLRHRINKTSAKNKHGKCSVIMSPPETYVAKQKGKCSKDTRLDKENVESLLEEIIALYDISNVPDSEKPKVTNQKKVKVSKELCQSLFAISPSIKRMGYRYSKFYIYALEINDVEDKKKRDNEIEKVLNGNGIFDYVVAQCTENTEQLMYVGARVEARSDASISVRTRRTSSSVRKGGTLGCFVNLKHRQRRLRSIQGAVLSRHVAEHCSDLYHVSDGPDRKIGSILSATCQNEQGSLDIAAAEMHEKPNVDGTKFKDSDKKLLPGRLHEYKGEDRIIRSGKNVYIWGSTSSPGLGKITAPEIIYEGMNDPLIQIEDKDDTEGMRFASEGGSGAIVCADDPEGKCVHALAMVVGTPVNDSTQPTKREYLTIPLSRGLKQIQRQIDKHVELC